MNTILQKSTITEKSEKMNRVCSAMHKCILDKDLLKDILFHSLYLLAQHQQMTQEDALSYVENDCATLDWFFEDKESESA